MGNNPKRIIITGASDGLGLRLAWLYAAQDAELILTGRKLSSELKNKLPERAHYITADQANTNCVVKIKAEVKRLGWEHIDNLILNAGYGQTGDPIQEHSVYLRDTMAVNLVSPIMIVRELTPYFVENKSANDAPQRSCITIIGSTAAKGADKFASYAGSKAGLSGFARALASEWRDRFDVQIIHPGPTNTSMQEKAGLNVGFARKLFVDPDFSASRIIALITARKQMATIGITQNIIWRITDALKLAPKFPRLNDQ